MIQIKHFLRYSEQYFFRQFQVVFLFFQSNFFSTLLPDLIFSTSLHQPFSIKFLVFSFISFLFLYFSASALILWVNSLFTFSTSVRLLLLLKLSPLLYLPFRSLFLPLLRYIFSFGLGFFSCLLFSLDFIPIQFISLHSPFLSCLSFLTAIFPTFLIAPHLLPFQLHSYLHPFFFDFFGFSAFFGFIASFFCFCFFLI